MIVVPNIGMGSLVCDWHQFRRVCKLLSLAARASNQQCLVFLDIAPTSIHMVGLQVPRTGEGWSRGESVEAIPEMNYLHSLS